MTDNGKKVYVGHEDTVWIIVGVWFDLLCPHSFSEAQFPLVIINGANGVLRCSFECTSLHVLTGFNKLIVMPSFPTLHYSFTANLNQEIPSLFFVPLSELRHVNSAGKDYLCTHRRTHVQRGPFFVFPFILLQVQIHRTRSRTCLQDTVRLTDVLPVSLARHTEKRASTN